MDEPIERRAVPAAPTGQLGSQTLIRELNERTLLDHLRSFGPLSRAQLARESGLSKPTVSLALTNLENAGLVHVVGSASGKPGPAAVLYEANPKAGFIAAVDIGRAWIRVAIADLAGTIVSRHDSPNRARSAPALVREIRKLAHQAADEIGLAWEDVVSTVIGSPGVLDPATGALRFSSNLPGWGRPGLVDELRNALGPDLTLENDVNLAALGEAVYGCGRGVDNFVLLSVGTGVGVGVIIDGRLYRGARGGAGEVGFFPLGDSPTADATSNRGVFEELSSADGVVRSARELGLTGVSNAKAVFEAAAAGDRRALSVVDQEGRRLAVAITAICALLDPEMVVLTGGVGRNTEAMLPAITDELARLSPLRPKVIPSELGDGAALLGALATALTHAHDVVFASRAAAARR